MQTEVIRMFRRIWSFIMSAVIFLCSLVGIRIGGTGGSGEMISYESSKKIVTISLDENPSTGYRWEYTSSPEGVLLLTNDAYHSDAPAGVVGAGGVRAFSFAGVKEGKTVLTFSYLRAWEGSPIRTVVIEVTVTADKQIEAKLLSDTDKA